MIRSPLSECMSSLLSPVRIKAAWYLPTFGLVHSTLPVAASTQLRADSGLFRIAATREPVTMYRYSLPMATGVEK